MHKDGLVTNEVQQQEHYPARKIYSITEAGKLAMRQWVLSAPEAPQLRKSFLVQLAWADQLSSEELDKLLEKYEYEISMQHVILQEQDRRATGANPARTPREAYIWKMVSENYIRSYAGELEWVKAVRDGLRKSFTQ
jgi:hypothetical protein